jgi:ketosteroid isomerase-like protein
VEIVRRALEAWQRNDLETFMSMMHPEVEWHTAFERLVEGAASAYRGREGIHQFWTTYRNELEDFKVDLQELRDVGHGRVVLLGHIRFRGQASRIEVESPLGQVITIRDKKMFRAMDYLSHEEALEAVGLRE